MNITVRNTELLFSKQQLNAADSRNYPSDNSARPETKSAFQHVRTCKHSDKSAWVPHYARNCLNTEKKEKEQTQKQAPRNQDENVASSNRGFLQVSLHVLLNLIWYARSLLHMKCTIRYYHQLLLLLWTLTLTEKSCIEYRVGQRKTQNSWPRWQRVPRCQFRNKGRWWWTTWFTAGQMCSFEVTLTFSPLHLKDAGKSSISQANASSWKG